MISRVNPTYDGRNEEEGDMRALVIFGLLAGFLAPLSARAQEAREPVSIATPNFSFTFSAGYVADELGLWQKHGLDAKRTMIAGIANVNAVISGSVDFAEAAGGTLTRAAAKGQRLLAIAITINRPFIQIVLRKELAAAAGFDPHAPLKKRGEALRGRTIAIETVGAMIHSYLRLVASRSGYDPEEIRLATMQATSVMPAFASKQIDGFAQSLPWTLVPVVDGSAVVIASGPDGDPPDLEPFAHNLVIARPETCEKRKSVCDKVGHVYAEAMRNIHEHPAEALALLQKRFATIDPQILAAAFDEMSKATPATPIVTKTAIENAEIYSIDAGLMKREDKLPSYEGLFTDAFVR